MRLLPFLSSIFVWSAVVCAQDQQCPHFSGAVKHRLEEQGRWLASTSLQRRIAQRSRVFGALVKIEQCEHLLDLIRDGDFAEELYFVAEGSPFAALVGRYRGTWTMAVVPYDKTHVLEANLLEITQHKWTLVHRDKDGGRGILATGDY
jgi:hypothetical protein